MADAPLPTGWIDVEYRDVEGFPGYRVGNEGSIWSRRVKGRIKGEWRRLKTAKTKNGRYAFVALMRDSKAIQVYVHQIVARAFIGPCPEGLEVAHDDGNGLNNVSSNICYKTHADNMKDKFRHGTVLFGEQIGNAKLDSSKVRSMRQEFSRGVTLTELSRRYNASLSNVHRVVNGQIWKRVS